MGMLHGVVQKIGKALRPLHAGDATLAHHRVCPGRAPTIEVESGSFANGGPVPSEYAEGGGNLSPPIRWGGLPKGTRELALLCEDPDAPMPTAFSHWVVYRVSPETTQLPEGIPALAEPGVPERMRQGKNTSKKLGYLGPAPPPGHGPHRYHFQLFALDEPLRVGDAPTREDMIEAMTGHVLGYGQVVGTYERD